ncbi:long-chain fatty acid-CoA ligase [Agyrium rufum]|nr:long-chain fatty acid-CoA ligase [Agyrium rufum]
MGDHMKELFPVMQGKGPFTVEVPDVEPVKGETIPRRHPSAKDGLHTTPGPGIKTIFDIIRFAANKFGNAKAMGSRPLIQMHTEIRKVKKTIDGKTQEVDKKWTLPEFGPYNYISFIEYEQWVLQVGSGLRKLGMSKGDRMHIFGATSWHWLSMAHGAVSQSIPIATAYDTLGEDGLKHSLVQTGSKAIYTDPHLLPTLMNPLKEAKEIKFVIYNSDGDVKQQHIDELKSAFDYLTIMSFEELRKLGESNMVDAVPPEPEDLCCIMYTSGSTGTPKGAPLLHKAVVAAIAGVDTIVGPVIGPGDYFLTYLPTAHILEFVFETACLYWGGTMGYGSPRTLSDTSVKSCKGDIQEFRPTILVGVPAVWETVRKGIVAKVNASNPVVRNLFWSALSTKSFLMANGLPGSGVLDAVVFKKIRDATGGRMKLCLNGGGPIAKDTQRFISFAICPMVGGYGLTETTAMGALMSPFHWTDNAMGEMPSSIEIKLVDFDEAGYFTASSPPQGEIWIRGAPIIQEYYENEQETKEALTPDGWFKTGDIGEFDSRGLLRLIDRKKNLVKTQNGEYIALEKLESVYRTATVVANICVYADPQKAKPIAIVVPAEPALKKLADSNGVKVHGLEELCKSDKVNAVVLKELQAAGKAGSLAGIEIIDGVVLVDEEWTSANGMVTAAQKINRKAILAKYKKQVDKAYGDV